MDREIKGFSEAVKIILKKFSIETAAPEGCESYREVLERMLEPNFILYQEIEAGDIFPEHKHEYIVALKDDGTPCAICPSFSGCEVVSEGRKERYKKQTFVGKAFIVNRPFPKGMGDFWDFLRLTASLLRPIEYLVLIGAPLLTTLLGLLLPRITNMIVNELLPAGVGVESGIFISAFILFFTVGILRGGVQLFKNCFMVLVKKHVSVQMESAVMARMLLLPEEFLGAMSTGSIPLRLAATCTIVESILNAIFDALVTILFALAYIPQMFSYSPVLILISLPFLILQAVAVFMRVRLQMKNTIDLNRVNVKCNEFLYDSMNGMQKIHAYHTQEHIFKVWKKKYENMLEYKYNPHMLLKQEKTLPLILSYICTAVLVAVLKPAGISTGTYLAFSSSYGLLATSLLQLNNLVFSLFMVPSQLELVSPVFKTEPESTEKSEYVKIVSGDVSFKDVTFAYGEGQPNVLENVSFRVRKGEKVAIVGPSGCGKSTFLKLLIGFLAPDGGEVQYDGRNLRTLNKKSLRRRIGIILQTSRLMPGTFATNLRYAKADATESQLWEAIDKASARKLVESYEQKLETPVPDIKNYGLSGGQQQLLLLARSYVGNPGVMILDEAFSALDAETNLSVLGKLLSCDATVFMVSHRLSSVRNFDRILVLNHGKIAEEGSFNELMRKDGLFSRMAAAQNLGEENE